MGKARREPNLSAETFRSADDGKFYCHVNEGSSELEVLGPYLTDEAATQAGVDHVCDLFEQLILDALGIAA